MRWDPDYVKKVTKERKDEDIKAEVSKKLEMKEVKSESLEQKLLLNAPVKNESIKQKKEKTVEKIDYNELGYTDDDVPPLE